MKFSYNWLKELSETKKTPQEIAQDLTLHSFEVENVLSMGANLKMVKIGEVLAVTKHPDADKLNVAKINIGGEELQIVCGAPNLKVGQKVPVALVGAILPGNFKIKEAEIRGIKSSGMICAEDELGLGDNHEGIMVLATDAPVGENFVDFMKLDDTVLEIDILPNRAHDALSYAGVAREIALLEKRNILNDDDKLEDKFTVDNKLAVTIETPNCIRYIGAKIKNIKIAQSPDWLIQRLKSSDINPINNIVDITNYVMLETGQPLHAFSANGIDKIKVRQATGGEKLTILNGEEVILRENDIVITDGEKAIALAGVMGGLASGVKDDTIEIILESANFKAVTIRRTKSAHVIDSDAAYRYERDIDPNFCEGAMNRALNLILEITGGEIESITDNYPKPILPWEIKLSLENVAKLLGAEIPEKEIEEILKKLGVDFIKDKLIYSCEIPTRRIDLKNQEDLIEEIGRVYGYDKILIKPLKENVQVPFKNNQRFLERKIKSIMVHSGFDELRSYSFYSRKDALALGLDDEKHITLLNPMSIDQELIRRTLVNGLLHASKKSLSYFDSVYAFEIGKAYTSSNDSLPEGSLTLSITVAQKGDGGEQFFVLKRSLENLFLKLGISGLNYDADFNENEEDTINFHPARKALIKDNKNNKLGAMGEITKSAHKYFGFKKTRVAVAEINLNVLEKQLFARNIYKPLAKFPPVQRDISLSVKERTLVFDVEKIINSAGGELLRDLNLFDIFFNTQTKERSMAFHLIFFHPERTLTTKEVDEKIILIVQALKDKLNIDIKK